MEPFAFQLETEGTKRHIMIAGFRGCEVGADVEELLGRVRIFEDGKNVLAIQLFNADRIATHHHLLASTIYSLQAFKNSRNISNRIANEILLYASAQRQIAEAVKKVGIQPTSRNLAAVIISTLHESAVDLVRKLGRELGGATDASVLSMDESHKIEELKEIFRISDMELEAATQGPTLLDAKSALTKRILSRISIMAISK